MTVSIFADGFRQQLLCRDSASAEETAANEPPVAAGATIDDSGDTGPCRAIELAARGASVVVVEAGLTDRGAKTPAAS